MAVPYDIDIEQAFLGALMVDNFYYDRLPSNFCRHHLYDPLHQKIFRSITELITKGDAATPLTVAASLGGDDLKEVGGKPYLVNLAKTAPPLPNIKEYGNILIDLSVKRELIRASEIISTNCSESTTTPAETHLQEAEAMIFQIAENTTLSSGILTFSEAVDITIKATEDAFNKGGLITGVKSGFRDLDHLLGGFHQSDLVIIAGRPGMGKTALATNIACQCGVPVGFFSLEMSASQLSARVLSEKSEIEGYKLRNGKLTDPEWKTYLEQASILRTLPITIDDSGASTMPRIISRARKLKREKKLGLVIIDYLQLISPDRRYESRVQEVSEITKQLKSMAKDLSVPVIALSQLSRGVDSRDDKRPLLSDLRESGSIEQDADVVMFVFREAYYLKTREPEPGTSEHLKWIEKLDRVHDMADVLVEKNRHGPTNKIELKFDERYTKFMDKP